MLIEFIDTLKNQLQITRHNRILISVSGGMDSVALLDLFSQTGCSIAIAHCNFGLRGNESNEDEVFVKQLGDLYGVPVFTTTFDTLTFAKVNHLSLQVAARGLRYQWFYELLREYDYEYISTAHHLSDQFETVLLNLTKGTGIRGLSGIPKINNKVIRPFLNIPKEHIADYVKINKLRYREDSSNKKNDYQRNKIRNLVVPVLSEINPSLEKSFLKTLDNLTFAKDVLIKHIEDVKQKVVSEHKDRIEIDLKKLKKQNSWNKLLFHLLEVYGFNSSVSDEIVLSSTSGGRYYTDSFSLLVDRDQLIITQKKIEHPSGEVQINKEITHLNNPVNLFFSISQVPFTPGKNEAYFDLSKLTYPLILRRWQKGDKFVPSGMKGFKKLSNYFIDNKFSIIDKANAWLLTSDDNIIWVVGERIDNRFKANADTKEVLKIVYEPEEA